MNVELSISNATFWRILFPVFNVVFESVIEIILASVPVRLPFKVIVVFSPTNDRSFSNFPPTLLTVKFSRPLTLPSSSSSPPLKTRVSLSAPKSISPVPLKIAFKVTISFPDPTDNFLLLMTLLCGVPAIVTSSSPLPIKVLTFRVELDIVSESLSDPMENINSASVSLLLVIVESVTVTVSLPLSVKISPAGSSNEILAPLIVSISS